MIPKKVALAAVFLVITASLVSSEEAELAPDSVGIFSTWFQQNMLSTTAIEGSTFTMECPPNHGIRTRGIMYGKDSPGCNYQINWKEHTKKVARKCDSRRKCEVPASNELFGDPCVGTQKELIVGYECVAGVYSDLIGEDGVALLNKCPSGKVIKIQKAFYGRNILTCDSPPKAQRLVEIKCNGHQTCTVPANNEFFGDPCLGVVKYLDVSYACVPSENGNPGVNNLPPETPTKEKSEQQPKIDYRKLS